MLFCGRHGNGSKLQALVNDSPPLAIQLESANPHEAKIALALLDLVDKMPDVAVADRAYDLDDLRDEFAERTSKLLAPHSSNHKNPPRDQQQIGRHYKQRRRVERLFAWLVCGWWLRHLLGSRPTQLQHLGLPRHQPHLRPRRIVAMTSSKEAGRLHLIHEVLEAPLGGHSAQEPRPQQMWGRWG